MNKATLSVNLLFITSSQKEKQHNGGVDAAAVNYVSIQVLRTTSDLTPLASNDLLYSAWLVAVKIKAVAIEVFHSELTQTPGLLFERLNDSRAQRAQFIVCGIDVCRKYPVN